MRAAQSELCVGRTAAQQPRWSAPLCALDNTLRFPRVCLCSPCPLRPDARAFFCETSAFVLRGAFSFLVVVGFLILPAVMKQRWSKTFCSGQFQKTELQSTQELTVHSQMLSYQNNNYAAIKNKNTICWWWHADAVCEFHPISRFLLLKQNIASVPICVQKHSRVWLWSDPNPALFAHWLLFTVT